MKTTRVLGNICIQFTSLTTHICELLGEVRANKKYLKKRRNYSSNGILLLLDSIKEFSQVTKSPHHPKKELVYRLVKHS